jgi:hypothetical protein
LDEVARVTIHPVRVLACPPESGKRRVERPVSSDLAAPLPWLANSSKSLCFIYT